MEKNFDKWINEKKKIHEESVAPFYNEREIWWCALGVNVGFEQDGTGKNFDRPILIIKGFNKNTFTSIALTGRIKKGKYYHYLGKIEDRDSTANLSQIKLIDSKRLIKKMGTLNEKTFKEVQNKLKKMLFDS
ncbi:MAG: type II toxin-antitoxin system PemK/MazF family toxin [Candidatus Vogelbacteria bacterium]|nr:type II toxin-antitoxin system PemK/MazF family toxin [Candidatus Vogelbacteria bacterium]